MGVNGFMKREVDGGSYQITGTYLSPSLQTDEQIWDYGPCTLGKL